MKKIRLFFTAVMVLFCSSFALAQNLTITGVVTDEATGDPVSFASVVVKGTTTGVNTDIDGNYSISAPSDAVLQFSFMGYVTVEVPVNGQAIINVTMKADAEMLEDAIVVGYGTAKKIGSIVGSASSVSSAKLKDKPAANVGDALQGQVAGLQILSSTGEPMSTVSMRIRGVNSINSSTEPLFILDGSPVSSSVFLTLSSNDIENISVLKDASSTAIYGSRAANGVIYITTKKGRMSEKPTVQLRAQYGVSSLADQKIKLLNTDQWFSMLQLYAPETFASEAMQGHYNNAMKYGINTNWRDYFFNSAAPTWSADLNVSGATEKTDYFVSASAFSQEGTLRYSDLTRVSLRSNVNVKATDWLKLGANIQLTYQDVQTSGDSYAANNIYNPMWQAILNAPWLSPYEINEDGTYGEELDEWADGTYNPYYLYSLQPTTKNYATVNANTYLELNPVKGLVLRAAQALEAQDYRVSQKALAEGPFSATSGSGGQAIEGFQRMYRFTFSNTAEYKFSIKNDHHLTFLLGQEAIMYKAESFSASASGLSDIRQNNLSDAVSPYNAPSWSMAEQVFNSYFARASYDYNDKYYLDVTFRTDGSSVFGANKRWASFYSVGAMWNISRENFMSSASWIEDFRLKASYGTTGNSGLPSSYLSIGTVGSGTPYNGGVSWGIGNVSNPYLTWEIVKSLNVGLSARLWGFMNAGVEFYHKQTVNMLMDIPYSLTTGHSSGYGNIGEMRNVGVDIDLSFDIFQNKDWYINLSTNFNYNDNEITKLFGGRDEYTIAGTGQSYKVGHTYGEFFTPIYAGVDPRDGYPMWYDADGNKTKVFSEDLSQYTGKSLFAPMAGGVQLYVQWKGLALSADFAYVIGKYLTNNDKYFLENLQFGISNNYNMGVAVLDTWHATNNPDGKFPRYEATKQFDSSMLEDASFLRLKNLQLSYTFPEKLIKKSGFINSFRIYLSGRNLFTVTKYTGWDPEVDTNVSLSAYPNSRQIIAGVEFTF
ncbi:MAG: TonB-dependent receptor [Bacteroidetes bacterium]|uniref:TonB-dependent receptor n=1 Tax=Candidatus Merdivivens pullistercoris TaxID=2840873 RepID=A0A9D9I442_9BACT|nr:TonB-dependent receptor [Candidatus Merdivivens pullistercoris]